MTVTPVWTKKDPFSDVFGANAPGERVDMYRDYCDALLERRNRNEHSVMKAKREYQAATAAADYAMSRRLEIHGAVSEVKFDDMLAEGAIE